MSQPSDGPPRGIRLATVRSVPVYLGWSWLLLAGLVLVLIGPQLADGLGGWGYALAGLYAVGLLVCVLAHEAAHAVAARMSGHVVHRVVADLWGGHTAFEAARGTPGSTAFIALAGPAANLALAAVGFVARLLVGGSGLVPTALAVFVGVNLLLAIFNLLPGLPLDGGQVVESLVWGLTGDQGKGRVVAGWAGRLLVLVIVAAALLPAVMSDGSPDLTMLVWGTMIAAFLWSGASGAIASGQALRTLGKVDLPSLLEPAAPVPATAPVAALLTVRALPVVVDEAGRPLGLVDHAAIRTVPADQVGSTPVSAVTTQLPYGWSAELGTPTPSLDLVRAFQTSRSQVVAVTDQGRVVGIVRAERLNAALRRA